MNGRIFILLAGLAVQSSFAQGTFQNLNFESAIIVPIPGDPQGRVQFAPAFPGWTGFINGIQQTTALYNNRNLSSPYFALIGPESTVGGPIDGNYSAIIGATSIFSPAET